MGRLARPCSKPLIAPPRSRRQPRQHSALQQLTPPPPPTPARRNGSNFVWADQTTAPPTLQPSDQNATGPGYSHWTKVGGNAAEPNGQACAYAGNVRYSHFSGGTYVQSGTSRDLWGWVDVQCTYVDPNLHFICEFEVACAPAAGKHAASCAAPLRRAAASCRVRDGALVAMNHAALALLRRG